TGVVGRITGAAHCQAAGACAREPLATRRLVRRATRVGGIAGAARRDAASRGPEDARPAGVAATRVGRIARSARGDAPDTCSGEPRPAGERTPRLARVPGATERDAPSSDGRRDRSRTPKKADNVGRGAAARRVAARLGRDAGAPQGPRASLRANEHLDTSADPD